MRDTLINRQFRRIHQRTLRWSSVVWLLFLFLGACGPPLQSYVARSSTPPPMKFCFGELCAAETEPLLLGGTDYSAPTLENIARWQKSNHFAGKPYETIQADYRNAGYVWTETGLPCNCRCLNTAHAALGGKCLDAPMAGTALYEQVVLGRQ
jgi:hypothetical protein